MGVAGRLITVGYLRPYKSFESLSKISGVFDWVLKYYIATIHCKSSEVEKFRGFRRSIRKARGRNCENFQGNSL